MSIKPQLSLGVLQREVTIIEDFWRWGCYVACILTGVQRSLNRKLTEGEVQAWYRECVSCKFILHNDIPIEKDTNWWRCFVQYRYGAFNVAMQMFGGKRRAREPKREFPANMTILRWVTPHGYHFTYGSPEMKEGTRITPLQNMHDPDPSLTLIRRDGQRDMHIFAFNS